MIRILGESIKLLFTNLGLMAALVLTVWLPGNLLTNYLDRYVFGEDDFLRSARVTTSIEGLFGPLYVGAIVYAVSRIRQGMPVRYGEAMRVGLKNWLGLFVAEFVAGLFILGGFILLIVPGIILCVRYALIAPAIVFEDTNSKEARQRSAALTKGIRWQVFGAGLLFFLCYFLLTFVLYFPAAVVDALDTMPLGVVTDCLLDVFSTIITIAMTLFYLEARERELRAAQPEPAVAYQGVEPPTEA